MCEIGAQVLKYSTGLKMEASYFNWDRCMRMALCDVNIYYRFGIFTTIEENRRKPWSGWPAAGPFFHMILRISLLFNSDFFSPK